MTQPYACHNAFLASEEAAIANEGKGISASAWDVDDKAKRWTHVCNVRSLISIFYCFP